MLERVWDVASLVNASAAEAPFPLSRPLLEAVLADRTSDRFVCRLVWERLGYRPDTEGASWPAGPDTPAAWAEAFPMAPQLIAERQASVRLTRSIPLSTSSSSRPSWASPAIASAGSTPAAPGGPRR